MFTILEYRARESGRQASEAQREKGWEGFRARDKKPKETFFLLEEQRENFVAVTKWEMLAATIAMWKWAAVKKENGKTYDISSIKRVTKKFLEVSRCSRAKQQQRNVQKQCAARAKLLLLIRPIVVFHRFPALYALGYKYYQELRF